MTTIAHTSTLTAKQAHISEELEKTVDVDFYQNILLQVVRQTFPISIRLVDWFVTNYTKENAVHYVITSDDGSSRVFDVHLDYCSVLRALGRNGFDPFRRGIRSIVTLPDETSIETTVAQISFWHWAHKNRVLEHLKSQIHVVEKHMSLQLEKGKERKRKNKRRSELTKTKKQKAVVFTVKTKITFD